MNLKKVIGAALISVLFITSCKQGNKGEGSFSLNQVSWIKGKWMTESRMGLLHEEWKEENDTMWKARSYVADSAGATVFEELIELRESEDGLYYIPTIQSENNGKPVRFKAVKIAANEVVFENQAHDYPQRILYLRRTDGNITAVIDGIKNGKELREEFHFRKEK